LKDLLSKLYESFLSVLPIGVIVVVLAFATRAIEGEIIGLFAVGAVLVMIGMTLFSLGAEIAMLPIGNSLGSFISKKKNLVFAIAICFVIGCIITLAEPDLQVLSEQLKSKAILYTVAVGVGIFLVISLLRTFFRIKLRYILLISYALIFILAIFVPPQFLGIAFDSGGVTTGPITVPFLVSFGIGLAAVRESGKDRDDSFGLIALCSTGPVLAIVIIGLFGKTQLGYGVAEIPAINNFGDILMAFIRGFPASFKEVSIAIVPITVVFFIFQFTVLKLPKIQVIRIVVGLVYTYFGIVIFLTGVNIGFMPMGALLGSVIAASRLKWLLVPIGLVIGLVIVLAEPAVHVLTKQVEEITAGSISKKSMFVSLAIGISFSLGLSMLRVLTGISIWYFVLPVYVISIALSFFVPPIFTGIAFDSGGVAAGSMASAFLLPMGIGVSQTVGGNVLADAFGLVGFVAMTPLMTIQILGLVYKIKAKRQEEKKLVVTVSPEEDVEALAEFMEQPLEFEEDYETEVITLDEEKPADGEEIKADTADGEKQRSEEKSVEEKAEEPTSAEEKAEVKAAAPDVAPQIEDAEKSVEKSPETVEPVDEQSVDAAQKGNSDNKDVKDVSDVVNNTKDDINDSGKKEEESCPNSK